MYTRLKYSTIVIALVTVALTFAMRLPIRGIWTIHGLASTLWSFWLGGILASCRPVRLKKKIGIAALVFTLITIGEISYSIHIYWLIQSTTYLRPIWRFIIFSMLGWALGGNSTDWKAEKHGSASDIVTFITFAFLYAWTRLTAQYVGFCSQIPDAEALTRLYPVMSFIEYLPLFGAVWYGIRCAQSNAIYRLMSINWIRTTCIILIVLFGLFGILCLPPYRWDMIIFNPLFAYAVVIIVNIFKSFSIKLDFDWKRIFMLN